MLPKFFMQIFMFKSHAMTLCRMIRFGYSFYWDSAKRSKEIKNQSEFGR